MKVALEAGPCPLRSTMIVPGAGVGAGTTLVVGDKVVEGLVVADADGDGDAVDVGRAEVVALADGDGSGRATSGAYLPQIRVDPRLSRMTPAAPNRAWEAVIV